MHPIKLNDEYSDLTNWCIEINSEMWTNEYASNNDVNWIYWRLGIQFVGKFPVSALCLISYFGHFKIVIDLSTG